MLWVDGKGVIMCQNILLNDFAHVPTGRKKILRMVSMPLHFLHPSLISQYAFLIASITLCNLLLASVLLLELDLQLLQVLNVSVVTSCIFMI